LELEEFGIVTLQTHELLMSAGFCYAAALQNINTIRVAHARKSMRDQQDRPAREQGSDALEQVVLGPRIEGSRGLIQDHERGMAKERAG
jgi:hypothetical protein